MTAPMYNLITGVLQIILKVITGHKEETQTPILAEETPKTVGFTAITMAIICEALFLIRRSKHPIAVSRILCEGNEAALWDPTLPASTS